MVKVTCFLGAAGLTLLMTRVNLANVLNEGLRIGGRWHRMNSKVKVQTNKAKFDV
jgi:hypothetical protein